mmetsp:Transcript_7019/g.14231  ORF Transcript_7019/g.14231 Transcript_7019/m.14231 type:complete len:430 (-) Transcript_7019:1265-2554(-)
MIVYHVGELFPISRDSQTSSRPDGLRELRHNVVDREDSELPRDLLVLLPILLRLLVRFDAKENVHVVLELGSLLAGLLNGLLLLCICGLDDVLANLVTLRLFALGEVSELILPLLLLLLYRLLILLALPCALLLLKLLLSLLVSLDLRRDLLLEVLVDLLDLGLDVSNNLLPCLVHQMLLVSLHELSPENHSRPLPVVQGRRDVLPLDGLQLSRPPLFLGDPVGVPWREPSNLQEVASPIVTLESLHLDGPVDLYATDPTSYHSHAPKGPCDDSLDLGVGLEIAVLLNLSVLKVVLVVSAREYSRRYALAQIPLPLDLNHDLHEEPNIVKVLLPYDRNVSNVVTRVLVLPPLPNNMVSVVLHVRGGYEYVVAHVDPTGPYVVLVNGWYGAVDNPLDAGYSGVVEALGYDVYLPRTREPLLRGCSRHVAA